MASGRKHNLVTIAIAGTVAGAATVTGSSGLLWVAAGCVFGMAAGPDQDQLTINKAEWAIVKFLPVVGWLWLALWDIYARLIPHRSPLSHFPGLGTFGRALYLWCVWLILCVVFGLSPAVAVAVPVGFYAGWAVADAAHWVMDLVW